MSCVLLVVAAIVHRVEPEGRYEVVGERHEFVQRHLDRAMRPVVEDEDVVVAVPFDVVFMAGSSGSSARAHPRKGREVYLQRRKLVDAAPEQRPDGAGRSASSRGYPSSADAAPP